MSHIRVGRREPNHELEQLADRTSATAVGARNAQRTEPGATDKIDCIMGQDALALALGFALSDVVEQYLPVGRSRKNAPIAVAESGMKGLITACSWLFVPDICARSAAEIEVKARCHSTAR
ncbi:hypothetical protein [Bradyrhizobium sp.]|uniref:hypothetical protein n=1 Tax=Bradyrhizobium sp. TaxID=376 RepID=UPI003C1C85BA